MSKYKFCPRCGNKVLPGATFCGHCGYQFNKGNNQAAQPNTREQMRHNVNRNQGNIPPRPNPNIHHFNPRPRPAYAPKMSSVPPYVKWIITAVVIIAIGFGGVYGYQHFMSGNNSQQSNQQNTTNSNSNSSSNNSSSNSSSSNNTISKSTAQTELNELWSCAEDEVNNDSEDGPNDTTMSDYFTDGSDNDDYNQMSQWASGQNDVDSLKSIDLTPVVKSVNGNTVKYLVKYVFHHDSDNHHQGFMWTAHMTNSGGDWKIKDNKANNHPVYDHN